MQIITKSLSTHAMEELLSGIAPLDQILFLDIETTGLSAEKNKIYLIGCVYYLTQTQTWHLTQWFDQTGLEERDILSSFLIFAKKYRCLVHFNGDQFDLPFLKKRIAACALENIFDDVSHVKNLSNNTTDNPNDIDSVDLSETIVSPSGFLSLDLYKMLLPYRKVLGLPNCKQQTVETLFGTGRTETASGGDLVKEYQKYIADQSQDLLNKLVSHNEADLAGLVSLTSILIYSNLRTMDVRIRKAQANNYTDHDGSAKEELFLFFKLPYELPAPIYASEDHCYLKMEGSGAVLKLPLYTEVMKYFYANYKDYYFLPAEDMAVHKYLASYVEKSHRVQAKPETCYTRKMSCFLPQWSLFKTPFFKRTYAEKSMFFEFTDDMKRDRDFLSDYAKYVLHHLLE